VLTLDDEADSRRYARAAARNALKIIQIKSSFSIIYDLNDLTHSMK
jgi:hypothetical protein